MRKKVIMGLTAITMIVGGISVLNQYKDNQEDEKLEPPIIDTIEVTDIDGEQSVAKETMNLTKEQIKSIEKSRDPFDSAPIVREGYEVRDKEFNELKAKIEKRIEEMTEEEERKNAKKSGTEYVKPEVPFEERVKEEIEKIINGEKAKGTAKNGSTVKKEKVEAYTKDEDILAIVKEQSQKYGVSEDIILSIIGSKTSKDGTLELKDSDGTYNRGLMQINTTTSKWLAGLMNEPYKDGMEFDNETNIRMGTYFLSRLQKENDDPHYMLTAYYVGTDGAEEIKKATGGYISDYSKIVMNRMK